MRDEPGLRDERHPVLLFDGVCNLCNGAVQFIIRRDPAARIRFASLQSEAGLRQLDRYGFDRRTLPDSLILLENGRAYTHSAAVLRIARHLQQPWPMAYVFMAVPPFLRDGLYRLIARNRYRWFGKRESCMLPTPERSARFLQEPNDEPEHV